MSNFLIKSLKNLRVVTIIKFKNHRCKWISFQIRHLDNDFAIIFNMKVKINHCIRKMIVSYLISHYNKHNNILIIIMGVTTILII